MDNVGIPINECASPCLFTISQIMIAIGIAILCTDI